MAMSAQLQCEDSMKITTIAFLFCLVALSVEGASKVFPAATNANNTFFQDNEFKKTPTVNGVPVLTNSSGSITGQTVIVDTKALYANTIGTNTTIGVKTNAYLTGVPTGDGSGLTNLNPAYIASGTAPINISGSSATASDGLFSSTNGPTGAYRYGKVAPWGDSITAGNYFGITTNWPAMVAEMTGRSVYNGGVSGELSSQIVVRSTNSAHSSWFPIWWGGRNDIGGNYAADVALITNAINLKLSTDRPPRYYVFGLLTSGSETNGTVNHTEITNINHTLSILYGSHYYDMRAWLMANASADQADIDAVTLGTCPPSLMVQGEGGNNDVHPNANGMWIIAQKVGSLIDNSNFVDRPLMPSDMPYVWEHSHIGTLSVGGLLVGSSLVATNDKTLSFNRAAPADALPGSSMWFLNGMALESYVDSTYDHGNIGVNVYSDTNNKCRLLATSLPGLRLNINVTPALGTNFSVQYVEAGAGAKDPTTILSVDSTGNASLGKGLAMSRTRPTDLLQSSTMILLKGLSFESYTDGTFDHSTIGLNCYSDTNNACKLFDTSLSGMRWSWNVTPSLGTNLALQYLTPGTGARTAQDLLTIDVAANTMNFSGTVTATNGFVIPTNSLPPDLSISGVQLFCDNAATNALCIVTRIGATMVTNRVQLIPYP